MLRPSVAVAQLTLISMKAYVGLLSDYDEWAEWCEQTGQRNCTRVGDVLGVLG